jgi:hypothetical protein
VAPAIIIRSDAALCVGTTQLFVWLHGRHELDPNNFKMFPVASAPVGGVSCFGAARPTRGYGL